LADRAGWALFIGSAKGNTSFHELYERVKDDENWFVRVYKASETGVIHPSELDDAKSLMDEDEYNQEFECSWTASIKGAYYSTQMAEAEREGRIMTVPYERNLPVQTAWDLGVGDSTSIWFFQVHGPEVRIIDYYEASGEGLPHYAKVLQDKQYVYGTHWAPHDIVVRELGSGKSRLETARVLGITFRVAPHLPVDDGIDAVRNLLPRCWFDSLRCNEGIRALRNYRKEYDERRMEYKTRPLHDWSSHAADAFRYLAVSIREKGKRKEIKQPRLAIV
jgi:hypothetical protein